MNLCMKKSLIEEDKRKDEDTHQIHPTGEIVAIK